MNKPILIFIFALALLTQHCHSFILQLPVSQLTLAKVCLSIDKLQDLLAKFNTNQQNKGEIYRRVELTKGYLQEMRSQLSRYNNVIAGVGNTAKGQKNLIIGNFNLIEGDNNWVFVSSFGGKINGLLLVGEWMVQLEKSALILKSPRLAISYIDQQKNLAMKKLYGQDERQLAKWDTWTRPDNKQADQLWSQYFGYEEWKVTSWNHKNLRVDLNDANRRAWNSQKSTNGWIESSLGSTTTNTNSWTSMFRASATGGGANIISNTNTNTNATTFKPLVVATNPDKAATSTFIGAIIQNGWSLGSITNGVGKWMDGWSWAK